MPRNPKKPGAAAGKKKKKAPSSAAAAMASAAAKKAGAVSRTTPQQPRVWLPGTALDPDLDGVDPDAAGDVELEYDPTAYDCLHRFQIEWPALSLDLPRDALGAPRSAFPHELFVVAGTQADQPRNNCLALLRLTHLGQGRHGKRDAGASRRARRRDGGEEAADTAAAGKAAAGGNDARMSEDDDDDEIFRPDADEDDEEEDDDDDDDEDEEDEHGGDEPPRMHYRLVAQPYGTNRVRCATQRPGLVAVWADTGSVRVLDVSAQLQEMAQDEHPKSKSASRVQVRFGWFNRFFVLFFFFVRSLALRLFFVVVVCCCRCCLLAMRTQPCY
jgi:ribosome assembly protein RRB1